MGCINNQQCGGVTGAGIVARGIKERQSSGCHECCSTDGCNSDLCKHQKPSSCIDDETVDCAKMNSYFHVCQDIHQAKLVCPKFCNLCTLVDGNWADWSLWSSCDVTCDNGSQTRSRICTDPAPANGGLDCIGSRTETKICQRDSCPVHGGWSLWTAWGSCSVTCGVGMQRRDRSCSNPYPSLYGDHCFGEARDDRICMSTACSGWKIAFTAHGVSTHGRSVIFPIVDHNYGGGYNSNTGTFTCPVAGIYYFAVTLRKDISADSDQVYCQLFINSHSTLGTGDNLINDDKSSYSMTMSGTFHLNRNDHVSVGNCYGADALMNSHDCAFTGFIVLPDN
ncbi:thrombospondin-2-like isoform X2 [Mercenaria mercenaria]|nr:thrombospondin-2-like isoform X2 [Mercenaria mercenaria]